MRVALLVGGPVVQGVSSLLVSAGWTIWSAEVPKPKSAGWWKAVAVVVSDPQYVSGLSGFDTPVVALAKHFPDGENSARALLAKGAVSAVERCNEATLLAVMNAACVLG